MKATAAPRKPWAAPTKAKSAKKATSGRSRLKPPRQPRKLESRRPLAPPEGQQCRKPLNLLKNPGRATLKELMKATGWQPHSARAVRHHTEEDGPEVTSVKGEDGERCYSIEF
jgi:hypothetical protein